jgi:hypothetical protein
MGKSRIRTWIKRVLLAVTVVGLIWIGMTIGNAGPKVSRMANRWICPCVFLEQRTAAICESTVPLGAGSLVATELNRTDRVSRVTAFGLYSTRAQYHPGEGCELLD